MDDDRAQESVRSGQLGKKHDGKRRKRRATALAREPLMTQAVTIGGVGNMQNLNCSNFRYQEDAQAALNRNPSDPNGLDAHPGPADGNDRAGGDGKACEVLPHKPASTTTSGQTVTSTTVKPTTLAHTGPTYGVQEGIFGSIVLLIGVTFLAMTRRRRATK